MKPLMNFLLPVALCAAMPIAAFAQSTPSPSDQAEQAPTPPAPGATPPPAPLPPGPPPPPEADAAPASVDAKVERYLINPFGDIDALLLDNKTIARMPPHMSADLVAAVKPGDAVTIQGRAQGPASLDAFSVTNTATKQVVVRRPKAWTEISMPARLRSMGLKELKVSGKVGTMLTGPHGEPNGVLLDDGTIVRIGPHEAYGFAALLKPGADFAAVGYGTENSFGRAIEATSVGATAESLQPVFK